MASEQQYLYFAKCPPLEEMEAVTLIHKHLAYTVPILQMKCRELARADVNCIITPVSSSNDNTAWAIAKSGYFSEYGTQQKLSQLGFEVTSKNPVTAEILQRCYQFSMIARMAPKWNRIGVHLVQGCEFFCSGKTSYVDVDVNVTATEIVVALKAGQIKFNFIKPEDLITTPSLMQHYKSAGGMKGVVTETSIENRRCTLLPNCTRGFVYSVSATVPVSQQYPTYNSIRIHWKKHHGFVLPDQQSTFYQIYFTFRPSQLLSYPACCVLQYPPITYKCKDSATICTSFVDCLHSRLPTLCGYPINYTTQLLQPDIGLSTALHCQTFVNLSRVGKKPASVGSSYEATDYSDSVVKTNQLYKPVFYPSPVSSERKSVTSNHSQHNIDPSHQLLSIACSQTTCQSSDNNSHQIDSITTTSLALPTKMIASNYLHKDNNNSSDQHNRVMLHDVNNSENSSLIAQITKQKVATLKKWLMMNNVKFKAKGSKKDDLVKLVATHIKDVRGLIVLSSEE